MSQSERADRPTSLPPDDFIEELRHLQDSVIWLPDPDAAEVFPGLRGIIGTGIDAHLVEAAEVFLRKPSFAAAIFTPDELKYCMRLAELQDPPFSYQRFAAHFAAKEAVAKALGGLPGGIHSNWRDIEVRRTDKRKPFPQLHGEARELALEIGVSHLYLSLTHLPNLVIAQCIAFGADANVTENAVNKITS